MIKLRHLLIVLLAFLSISVSPADSSDDVQARNAALTDYARLHELVGNKETPILWLFVGDSITHGCLHTHGYRSFPEHWMEIVKWEIMPVRGVRRTNDIVINTAVSGETAAGFLSHAAWRLQQFRPHVVFINFGINDGTRGRSLDDFRADLTQIITLVRAQGAIPVLQTPSLTLKAEPYRPDYAAAVRETAEDQQVLLVDHTAAWEDYAGTPGASTTVPRQAVPAPAELMNDNLHPNGFGHRLMARTLAQCLGLIPGHSRTLQLPLR